MASNHLVSIIIPTFNREKKLPEAIESALNQTYKPTQIIVVDDGSTDQTAALVSSYPTVEYYYQANKGQAAARNTGLGLARGSIVASLDSDDLWNPDFLTQCVNKLDTDQSDFVFANWEQESRYGENWDFLSRDPYLQPFLTKATEKWIDLTYQELRTLYLNACPSPSSSVVVRKSSIVSGWDEQINIGDDWCMYLEMILSKPCKVSFTMQELWKKRVDEINIYDGRKWSEVLELLYVADLEHKMAKFSHLLSPAELQILQRRYMGSLVELAKHKLIREHNLSGAFGLLGKSFAVNPWFTVKEMPKVVLRGLKGKMKSFSV